jgi:hypothetical protein
MAIVRTGSQYVCRISDRKSQTLVTTMYVLVGVRQVGWLIQLGIITVINCI